MIFFRLRQGSQRPAGWHKSVAKIPERRRWSFLKEFEVEKLVQPRSTQKGKPDFCDEAFECQQVRSDFLVVGCNDFLGHDENDFGFTKFLELVE